MLYRRFVKQLNNNKIYIPKSKSVMKKELNVFAAFKP